MDDVTPLPQLKQEAKTMPFYEAIKQVVDNKRRATRLDWNSNEEFVFIAQDGEILIHTKGADHRWILQVTDVLATDWCLLPV